MAGFETITIEEATECLIDYRGKTPPKTDSGIRLITAKVIKNGRILEEPTEFIATDFYDEWMRRGLPQKLDVLVTTEAPLGEVAILREREQVALAQRVILLRAKPVKVEPLFLFYALQSWFTQGELKSRSSGTTVSGIKQSELRKVRIPIFPLSIQRKIAGILSPYDDLIENNLRRIKILEEMAQTLYREWFVKFRFPGHQKVKMVDSSLGKIPEGWGVKSLESLISEHIGGGWGKEAPDKTHTESGFVVRGTDIPDGRYCNISNVPYRYHTLSNLQPRRLTGGDIIFEVSGGSKGQPVGRTLIVSSKFLSAFGGEHVICASFCKRIKPNARLYASEILYLSFLEAYGSGEIEQFQVQSTGISNFKWTEYIQQTYRVIPPDSIQVLFLKLIDPLFSQIVTLGLKNRNLRRTRDLFLPKLISGELDVLELDITIPEANA
jgi:type I restriction enzyme S subunit